MSTPSSSRLDLPRIVPAAVGPQADEADQRTTRARLCDGEPAIETDSPHVLDAYALILDEARSELGRSASALCGGHDPAMWRRALRGGCRLSFADVVRLAMHPTRESKAYVLALLRPVAARLGYRLERIPAQVDATTAVLAASAIAERTQAAVGAGTLDALANDGRIDSEEAARLLVLAVADEDASIARRVALERLAHGGAR